MTDSAKLDGLDAKCLDAAIAAFKEFGWNGMPAGFPTAMRAYLRQQALSAPTPTEVGEVKPLQWRGPDVNGDVYARSLLGTYTIRAKQGSLGYWLTQVGGYHRSIDEAKAAAFEHFRASILSAITRKEAP